jgi:hypothetical protein
MASKRRENPIKKRERRAKIAAAVGGVLFLAVAAYEVPSLMKMMNQKPPSSSHAATATPTSGGTVGLPDVGGASGGVSVDGALANTDLPPASDGAQLVSFSVFQPKNPFAPQVRPAAAGTSATTTTAERPGADAPSKEKTATATTTSLPPGATVVPSTGGAAATTPTSTIAAPPVTISVNGQVSQVGAQGTFPTAAPVFRLVAFTSDSADIGIVGGSLASGDVALTLHVGHAVTLQNTTDGKTYKLELLSTH